MFPVALAVALMIAAAPVRAAARLRAAGAEAADVQAGHPDRLRRRHRPRLVGQRRQGADGRRLRGHRGRQAADDPQLHLRRDLRRTRKGSRPRTCWPRPKRGWRTTRSGRSLAAAAAAPAAEPAPEQKMSSDALAGRRLIVLLFDISSMQPEDVQRAVDSATKYVNEKMSPADMVAVATVSSTLDVLSDFSADRSQGRRGAGGARLQGRDRDAAAVRRHRGHRRRGGGRRLDGDRRRRGDGHVQQRHPPARAQGARGNARADRAEEVDPLFQRRHAAERRRQPGRAAGRDQRGRPRARGDLSGRHARAAGGRPRRRRQPGERARQRALLRPRRRAAVLAAHRVAGHARLARRRHRRQGLPRLERLRRGLRPRAARHVRLLPARLRQRQHREGRPLPPHPRPREEVAACASRRAPVISRTATSRTPPAATAKRRCRSSSSPPSPRPTCRSW